MNPARVPVWPTVCDAYRLIWTHRLLHAKAIWAPIAFLVTAEVCYRRIFHGGDTLDKIWSTLGEAPWYWIAGLALCWLAGLKFLLSFSISWRRHLALGETFNPFYFKRPFWRYLLNLVGLYGGVLLWAMFLSGLWISVFGVSLHTNGTSETALTFSASDFLQFDAPFCVLLASVLWGITRSVPRFTAIALAVKTKAGHEHAHPGFRTSVRLMQGNVSHYLAAWLLAMAPVIAFTFVLGNIWKALGLDLATLQVALADSVLRQAALFVHFSLGASIGLLFYQHLTRPAPSSTT